MWWTFVASYPNKCFKKWVIVLFLYPWDIIEIIISRKHKVLRVGTVAHSSLQILWIPFWILQCLSSLLCFQAPGCTRVCTLLFLGIYQLLLALWTLHILSWNFCWVHRCAFYFNLIIGALLAGLNQFSHDLILIIKWIY